MVVTKAGILRANLSGTRTAKRSSNYHESQDGSEPEAGRRGHGRVATREQKTGWAYLASGARRRQSTEAIFSWGCSGNASGAGSILCERSGRAARKL